ncbi:SDR family NAD(P)-dependent oxidoreductase [Streptomyces sp. NPDC008001]|uniref:SDR family NAD(P)-dependent oxidoreductase n=1 Tax=Streptomyces sp. NPDC008001 TaxID=3364804 RepID=UPI0036E577D5
MEWDGKAADRAVAVVGAACRLPGGVDGPDRLREALDEGRDLVTEVPADRFPAFRFVDPAVPRPGKSYTGAGGFLDDIASFDADYFGISPKEAAQMDPQQRLLLELAVEACDDAGIAPAALAGSDTAVHVGISDTSYGALQMLSEEGVNAYTMSGAASAIAANRISHFLDLRGPSLIVDTACSSSLVALVQACRTVLDGTSRCALAGGVNLLLSPYHFVGFCQAAMLSPSGRCRPFSARADGYVRAEGGGMVVLKRLSDALADGDRVRAVLAGGACNSDGRTMGLALPNPRAQEQLLRDVYDRSGVDPDDVLYVEAHGTGTPAGDPAECLAIGRALGVRRTRGDLPVGSVKSNLGHLEPASGMAGLLKAMLVLQHGVVPPTLHATPPSEHIDFSGLRLRPVVEPLPVEVGERSVVGVNSFGFGGANAHVVVAPPPPLPAARETPAPGERPVVVSARSAAALREAALRTARRLAAAGPEEFYDLAWTAALRRGLHPHRAVVLATTPEEAGERLERLVAGAAAPSGEGTSQESPASRPEGTTPQADAAETRPAGTATPVHGDGTPPDRTTVAAGLAAPPSDGAAAPHPAPPPDGATGQAVADGRVVFAFAGNGAQWAGMGADLLDRDAGFREAVLAADAAFAPHLGWSVAGLLADSGAPEERLAATEVAQPLLFAVQVGIVEVLRRRGVVPAAVVGHSVGEIAAAHVAGVLSLEDAARLVAVRGSTQAGTAGTGRMLAVPLPLQEAAEAAARRPGLEVACVNSDRHVTVSGPAEQLAALAADLAGEGVACVDVGVAYAFHSRAMDPAEGPLKAALQWLRPGPARIPVISTVTGGPVDGEVLDAAYWWRNIREPVDFRAAVGHLRDAGFDVFTEIGPHPVLCPHLRRTAARGGAPVAVVPTLARGGDGPSDLRTTVARLTACGARLDRSVPFPVPGRVADLPAYPWQRQRHWNGGPGAWTGVDGDGGYDHPLLGERLPLAGPVWRGALEPVLVPWLADHRVGGAVILPATAYVEMALAAGRRVWDAPAEVRALELTRALVVPREKPDSVHLQCTLSPDDGILTVASGTGRTGVPQVHARGQVRLLLRRQPAPVDLAAVRERCGRRIDGDEHYRALYETGLDYGPAFRPLRELRVGRGETLASYRHEAPADGYEAHPALLDGALQAGFPLLLDLMAGGRRGYLPAAVGAARVWRTPSPEGMVHVRERSSTPAEVCWDVTVTDDDGTVTAELEGCRLRRLDRTHTTPLNRYALVMRAAPHPDVPAARSPLPPPSRIAAAAGRDVARLQVDWRRSRPAPGARRLKECYAAGSPATVAGLLPDPTAPFTVDDLVAAGVLPAHRRLAEHLLVLAQHHGDGVVPAGDGRWRLTRTESRLADHVRQLVRDFPAAGAEIALLASASTSYGALLTGATDPLELLYGDGGRERVEQFYDIAPTMRLHNRLLQTLAREAVRRWPADRPLRVLEVGAGTGGTTAALLPVLPVDRTRYCFTDISPLLVARAEKRFAAHDFVEYAAFDLDGDPLGQGFAAGSFDLVVAANALHTAKDLAHALTGLRRLLTPGGHLMAIEMHDPELLAPLFGTLAGFWHATDRELRPASVLLPAAQWPGLLRRCGFTDVTRTGDGRRDGAPAELSVLLAAAPDGVVASTPLPCGGDPQDWVVAGEGVEGAALPAAVAGALGAAAGGHVTYRPDAPRETEQWTELLGGDGDMTAVLLLDGPEEESGGPGPEELLDLTTRRLAALRAFAAACETVPDGRRIRLWLVTRPSGALPFPERPLAPQDAAVWGATRSLANELPHVTVRRLSLERTGDVTEDAHRAARELLTPTDEDEIALTAGGRFVPRLVEETDAAPQGRACSTEVPAFALEVRNPGLAYELAWVETEPPPAPGPGEVVIAVRAAALNYRDVMQAVGFLTPDSGLGALAGRPGMECAGVVTATGPDVTTLSVGDRVFALAPCAFASHVRTAEHAVGRLPRSMGFAEGATVPVAFLTVHYALGHLARLAPGETLLVHGGAGGVGLAALQYARRRGARVIATAGNDLKRDLLRMLGAEHVLDSRSLAFAEEIRELTGGRGVDVVLNSLAGEAIPRGLEVLRPGGRFVELGKRDIEENKPLLLRPFRGNIAFFGVDLTALLHEPELARAQFRQVATLVRTGRYRPPLHSVHPAARVTEAFRLMQHSRHIGKLVVSFDPLDEPLTVERRRRTPRLDGEATYLVAGGLGGFGAATARRLAGLGARHLALLGRRGAGSPEAPALLAELADRGVTARAHAVDVTDEAAVRGIVEDAAAAGRPVRGVVHSAMHVDDAPLTDLDDERLRAVLAPKAAGAAVLDAVTRGRPLDLFVVYSSIAAFVGNIGQAPYAAANVFLEALVRRRRQEGLAGTVLVWGALGGTGYVERNGMTRMVARAGLEPVTPEEAFAVAEDVLAGGAEHGCAGRCNWVAAHRLLPTINTPRLVDLLPTLVEGGARSHERLLEDLVRMPADEALAFIADSLAGMLAAVLELPAETLDHHRRLDEYGLDSLMATELLVTLRQQYDVDIPPMELLRSDGTVADLARIVHARLGLAGGAPAPRRDEPGD